MTQKEPFKRILGFLRIRQNSITDNGRKSIYIWRSIAMEKRIVSTSAVLIILGVFLLGYCEVTSAQEGEQDPELYEQLSQTCASRFDKCVYTFRIAMPGQANPKKFPSLPDGSPRIGYAGMIIEKGTVKGEIKRYIYPLSKKANTYLNDTKGIINVGEVYASTSDLCFEMPRIAIYGSEKSPLSMEAIETLLADGLADKSLGKKLVNDLIQAGKARGGKLTETVVFVPAGFQKLGAYNIVSDWTPETLTKGLSSKKTP
jgi:hypothetical protein